MKTTGSQALLSTTAAALLCLSSGALWAGTEGTYSTFYGLEAGTNGSGASGANTFVGRAAGYSTNSGTSNVFLGSTAGRFNTSGYENAFLGSAAGYNSNGVRNTFIGTYAGYANTTGLYNTAVGHMAGYSNSTGWLNVFLGYQAGYSETGSNKLYIDNCRLGSPCTSPLIYGEFDNHLLKFNAAVDVTANGVAKSQLHFSQNGTDVGGWLTSVAANNFFMSSGAKYDAAAGGWIQKSGDGKAVMAGSGASGYRVYTNEGAVVGANFTPVSRLHIDYSGNLGLNALAVAGQPITSGTGAVLSAGGAWLNASSRDRKENIQELSAADAQQTLAMLSPVSYNYRVDREEKHVGFIAEDVPEMVASKDRKSLSALDIVAVLTKVVQEQKHTVEETSLYAKTEVVLLKQMLQNQKHTFEERGRDAKTEVALLKQMLEEQRGQLLQLAADVCRLKTLNPATCK